MKRRKIVAGNWKMNCTWQEALELVTAVKEQAAAYADIEKIVFPAFPFLQIVATVLKDVPAFYTGAQDCSEHAKGAYTGDVSAAMLRSAGCDYVLVGHSERRQYHSETAQQLISKIREALVNNLNVIYCFGEQLAERKNGKHFETVKQQLTEVLTVFPKEKTTQLVLAYEPVWAIGTGETATPTQAQEMHAFVRKTIAGIFSQEAASVMPVLYGGSCNAQNAPELFACSDVDGGLIGGASLKAGDFCKIINSF
jgi:triosephosphate isomerase